MVKITSDFFTKIMLMEEIIKPPIISSMMIKPVFLTNISTSNKNMLHRQGCKEIYKLLTQEECFIAINKTSSLNVRQRQADTTASISESPCSRYLSQRIRHINI
jgi:hypothetical protein